MHHNFFFVSYCNVTAVELTMIAVLSATSILFEVIINRVEVYTDNDSRYVITDYFLLIMKLHNCFMFELS